MKKQRGNFALQYAELHDAILAPVAVALRVHLSDHLHGLARVDSIAARAKTPDSFLAKANKQTTGGARKYAEPLAQIQDQIGARVVVLYESDVIAAREVVERYYHRFESRQ